jgi:prophage DNA circulation protein
MSIQERIRKGSYKGVEFDTISIERQRVKKNTEHQYANSVRRYIEERGVQNQDFTVTLSIFGTDDYFDKRDGLRSALESEGEGVLVLPLEGEFNVKCTDISDSQNILENLGRCDFTCTFKVIGEKEKAGNPVSIKNSKISLVNNISAMRSSLANVVNNSVIFSNALNYANGVSKYTNFANRMLTLASSATSGNSLASIATNFLDGMSTLLGNPVLLGSAVNTMFSQFERVFDNANLLFSSSETLFAFGDTDKKLVSPNTPEQVENQINTQVCNTQIQLSAVGLASNAFAQMEFDNEEELEKNREILTEQYNKIENSDFMQNTDIQGVSEISYYIKEARNDLADIIKEKKASTPKLVKIKPKKESVSMIAYKYYGNLDRVEGLIKLNDIQNPKSIEGEMRVYTNV